MINDLAFRSYIIFRHCSNQEEDWRRLVAKREELAHKLESINAALATVNKLKSIMHEIKNSADIELSITLLPRIEIARMLGMPLRTFYRKQKQRSFNMYQAAKIISVLGQIRSRLPITQDDPVQNKIQTF